MKGELRRNHNQKNEHHPAYWGFMDWQGKKLSISATLEKPFWWLFFLSPNGEEIGRGHIQSHEGKFFGEADLEGSRITLDVDLVTTGNEKHFEFNAFDHGEIPAGLNA